MGMAQQKTGKNSAAIKSFRRAIEYDEKYAEAMLHWAALIGRIANIRLQAVHIKRRSNLNPNGRLASQPGNYLSNNGSV